MTPRIYLDHAATTPMRPEAIAAVAEGMRRWANPSSPHAEGRAARAALEDARARIKAALGWEGELIFTSGASEALAIGLGRAKGGKRMISAVEHDSVVRAAPEAGVLPMLEGRLDRHRLAERLADAACPVVAIQHVNSETGSLQQIDRIAKLVREADGILVCDCAQSAGKIELPDADLIPISAHKLGGPPGIGALLVRDLALLDADGGQEFGYRGGTENLPGALGFAAAAEACVPRPNGLTQWSGPPDAPPDLADAIVSLRETVASAGGDRILPGGIGGGWIEAIAMPHMEARAQLIRFDMMGFAVSAGSACSSGSLKPSRALLAFGVSEEVARHTIRVSFGWPTTAREVDAFSEAWSLVAEEARARA